MTMSPFEVERQEFGFSMWGYRRREVDRFLDEVQQTLMGLWQERSTLRETNERLEERVARFTALEEQLKNTLIMAQDSAEKACEQARRESELIMREAGQKAREIVHTAHEERQRLEHSLRALQSTEQDSRQRLRTLAQAMMTQLEETEDAVVEGTTTLRALVSPDQPVTTETASQAAESAAARAAERMRRRDRPVGRPVDRPVVADVPEFALEPSRGAEGAPRASRPEPGKRSDEAVAEDFFGSDVAAEPAGEPAGVGA